ncbi:MAG: hypothetical protein HYS51_02355 [Candidatus Zambryskibacteria bacterium]|nr:hypothetical protein [Candidatus Zambryskibacteria bacterium]
MAEEAPQKKWYEHINTPTSLLIFLFVLSLLVAALLKYITSFNLGSPEFIWFRLKNFFLLEIWPIWIVASAILSALCIYGIVHNLRNLREINQEEDKIFSPPLLDYEISPEEAEVIKKSLRNEKWEKVMSYLNSTNHSDWRLAIMEADVMLEELLRTLGLPGDSVGEMLKAADRNEFSALDEAWEAHKVRNAIAHGGTGFDLNERETKRVIALFEKIFKEFGLVQTPI